jgi:hypothetical protein
MVSSSPLLLLSSSAWLRKAPIAGVLLVLAGCSGKADVTGKVIHQGKTVLFGTVIMQGPDGIPMTGMIQSDGTYVVQGVASGKVLIGIVSRDPGVLGGNKGRRRVDKGDANGGNLETTVTPIIERSKWFPIPQKYEDPVQSGIQAKIGSGSVSYDINLP